MDSPDAALREWIEDKDYLLAGIEPPTRYGGITIGELLDEHSIRLSEKVAAGQMSTRTVGDYATLPGIFESAGILNFPVEALTPAHFSAVWRVIANSGLSLRTQKNRVMSIKAVLNWGGPDPGVELFDCRIKYGPDFRPPKLHDIESQQEATGV